MTTVAIIGAGVGGLTTAAYLARAGLDVHVFEQHRLPGGYISAFSRRGFTFPSGPTSFVSNGMVFPILKELGLENACQFKRIHHQMSWDDTNVPFRTPAQTRDALIQAFPGQRRNLRRFFRWIEIGGRGFRDQGESGIYFSGGKGVFGKVLAFGLKNPLFPWAISIARGQTNRSLHSRFIKDQRLTHMLNNLAYPVMQGSFTLGMWSTYFHDYFIPVGGMQGFSDLFAGYLHEHGGHLHLGQHADKILIEDGAARGLRLADGSEFRADWVVSAADMHSTFIDMIGRDLLKTSTAAKLEQGEPSESIFVAFVGTDSSPEISTSLSRFQGSHVCYFHEDGSCTQMVLMSKDDPSLAPPGKHAIWIGKLESYQDWEGLSKEAYQKKKDEQTRALLKRAEEFIPHLDRHIEVLEAATPLTYERYTGNWRGAISGWSWDPARAPKGDFVAEAGIKNFYCVGHWVFKPAGVPSAMITGWYIARDILSKTTTMNSRTEALRNEKPQS